VETIERTPRPEKVAVVEDVEARLAESSAALLTEYRGISVANLEKLRRSLREVGGEYKIYKNTLVRRAAKSAGVAELESLLVGPTGITFVSGDVSAVAKVLRDFARENPDLVVKGGLIGKDFINASDAAALAELPSREVLLAQIAGMFAAPMQRFASLLNAVPAKFAYALSALIESRPAETSAPTAQAQASDEPLTEVPATEAPVADVPVAETAAEPETPAVAEPADETPADETPADDTPATVAETETDESGVKEPVADEAVASEEAPNE
jgi:large subunit ribosomal protein L10